MRVQKDVHISEIEIVKSRSKRVNLDTDGGELLVESVKQQGVLHPPLAQAPAKPGGKYRLVFGHRRLAAAKKAGIEQIRITVDDEMTDQDAEFATLAENLFRKGDKDPTERRTHTRRWWALHAAAIEAAGKKLEDGTHGNPSGRNGHSPDKDEEDEPKEESPPRGLSSDASQEEPEDENEPGQDEVGEEENEQEETQSNGNGHGLLDDTTKRFSRKLQEATGCSRSKAMYDAAIARAFTEDDLKVIGALKLPETTVRKLASVKDEEERKVALSLVMGGDHVDDAVAKAKGTLEEHKEANKESDDIPDGEWLDTWCGEVRKKLKNTKAFDTSALLYRRSRKQLNWLRCQLSHPLKCARLNKANDPLTSLLSMAVSINHPSQWLICGICGGDGSDDNGVECAACRAGGFKMNYGGAPKK